MISYDASHYQSTYENENGKAIWEFLNSERSITIMETATYLSRPAVEPLSDSLLSQFGEPIAKDRTKQMIGHMARQVMESHGYRIDRSNVKIKREDNIFSRATRYIK